MLADTNEEQGMRKVSRRPFQWDVGWKQMQIQIEIHAKKNKNTLTQKYQNTQMKGKEWGKSDGARYNALLISLLSLNIEPEANADKQNQKQIW